MTAAPPLLDLSRPPALQGFRWPAEWEPHRATWLAWPHKEASWPGRLEEIPPVFTAMIRLLAPGEEVRVNVVDAGMEGEIRGRLARLGVPPGRVRFFSIPHDDAWIRDHGPMFLTRGDSAARETAIVDWGYNAWGGKYPPFVQDDAVPSGIGEALHLPVFAGPMILEGGSVDGDGQGTVLTTEGCLLHPNRNAHLSRAEIEQNLRRYLGARSILWLGQGIAGDDTDGHVDDLARFTGPTTVVTAVEEDAGDVNYEPLRANLARLREMRTPSGAALEVIPLPMPTPVEYEGQRLPASYANFYIGNEVILLPTFGCPQDERARAILQRLFPRRRVTGLDARALVWGLGAFHCLTQQQP
ncbi:MAG: agmatine deiminase family protein [Terriglobales bacterium]